MPSDKIKIFKLVSNPFSIECTEEGVDLTKLRYLGRGEQRYGIGRQLVNRGCDDALVDYDSENGKGILLIERKAKPAEGYLWPLGGFTNRGVPKKSSLASRVKSESGLEIDESTMIKLGDSRFFWNTTETPMITISGYDQSSLSLKHIWFGVFTSPDFSESVGSTDSVIV